MSNEESSSRVAHWRKVIDNQESCILTSQHSSPLQMDTSTALLQQSRFDVEKESKLLPICVPMPKKDAVSGLAAIKEALTLCMIDRNLHQITGSSITRIQADGGEELNNQKLKDLCFDKDSNLSFSPAH